jgi:hypothetical protein
MKLKILLYKLNCIVFMVLLFCSSTNIFTTGIPFEKKNDEFTHSIFAEYGTATGCYYCKYIHAALKNIYEQDLVPFYYISLIDANQHSYERISNEYNIYGWPTVYVDGGYELVVGSNENVQQDMEHLNMSIENCSTRQVPDIHASLTCEWLGSAITNITVKLENNEPTSYSGHLRVYVTEIMSTMGWYDTNGDPYTFAFLDYAFNQNIAIDSGVSWQASTLWNGFDHDDGYGNDFGGIIPDNIMIFAVVYNDTIHQGYSKPPGEYPFDAYYVDEVTASKIDVPPPPELEIRDIKASFGGMGKGGVIDAQVANCGDANVVDIEWSISVKGGLLGKINVSGIGFISSLEPEKTTAIQTDAPIRGVGKLEAIIKVGILSKKVTGFIAGPFIVLL